MDKLNLPQYNFRFITEGGKQLVFDIVRKKYVVLTPEEWVRQNMVQFLSEKKYPVSLMAVEKKIVINQQPMRFDLLVYSKKGHPYLIAEFKAPAVKISQAAFDQVVRYNMELKVPYIMVSNGMEHFICKVDYSKNSYSFLKGIPDFGDMSG